MATLTAADLSDLTLGTLADLKRLRFSQIATDLQRYEVMSHWLTKKRIMLAGGKSITRHLMYDVDDDAAEHCGLYEVDDVNVADHMTELDVPWRHAKTRWVWERRELLMQSAKAMIYDVVIPRRMGAFIALAKKLESAAWSVPSTTDKKLPYGLPYWIVYNATTGFNGGLPGSHTTVGGVNLTTAPTYKNYTYKYTDATKEDLVRGWRTAKRKCMWRSPVEEHEYRGPKGRNYVFYMAESTVADCEDIGEKQNENLGRDLAPFSAKDFTYNDEGITFWRHPIRYIPYLDDNIVANSDPIYGVDHSTFDIVVLRGDYLRETAPKEQGNAHNNQLVWIDLSYNYICTDRRQNMLLAKADPIA
jgi:hypothetical protein